MELNPPTAFITPSLSTSQYHLSNRSSEYSLLSSQQIVLTTIYNQELSSYKPRYFSNILQNEWKSIFHPKIHYLDKSFFPNYVLKFTSINLNLRRLPLTNTSIYLWGWQYCRFYSPFFLWLKSKQTLSLKFSLNKHFPQFSHGTHK